MRPSHLIARHRRRPPLRFLARMSRAYLAWHGNLDYESTTNGELRVVARLEALAPRTIVDAGAHVGDWTARALEHHPSAVVHCFEPVPPTAEVLAKRFAGDEHVTVNAQGLSDSAGDAPITYHPLAPQIASLFDFGPYFERDDPRKQRFVVPFITGDSYCAAHDIASVDFLKIDTEGLDLRVLRGFDRMLAAGAIRAIQFEYGLTSVYSKDLLRDFYEYLEPRGYLVGKIFPTYVEFRPYEVTDEDFVGPNYLAVRRDDADVFR